MQCKYLTWDIQKDQDPQVENRCLRLTTPRETFSVLALSITYLALLVPRKIAGSTFQEPSSETDQLSKRKNATGGVDLRKSSFGGEGALHIQHKSPATLSMIFEV